jgi:hypothetical protein
VLRGADRNDIIRRTGLIVVNPPAAESIDPVTGARTERETPYDTVTFTAPDGTHHTVETHLVAGRLHHKVVDGDGTSHLVPLARLKNEARPNKDGTWRDYVVYAVPDPTGGAPRTLRLRTTNEATDPFNHAEHIHQIPKSDPAYDLLYGRRQDAESINRDVDDHLPLRRARSYGRKRQLLDLLGHAIRINTTAVALDQQRRHPLAA